MKTFVKRIWLSLSLFSLCLPLYATTGRWSKLIEYLNSLPAPWGTILIVLEAIGIIFAIILMKMYEGDKKQQWKADLIKFLLLVYFIILVIIF